MAGQPFPDWFPDLLTPLALPRLLPTSLPTRCSRNSALFGNVLCADSVTPCRAHTIFEMLMDVLYCRAPYLQPPVKLRLARITCLLSVTWNDPFGFNCIHKGKSSRPLKLIFLIRTCVTAWNVPELMDNVGKTKYFDFQEYIYKEKC
jgi:hypothetical protein